MPIISVSLSHGVKNDKLVGKWKPETTIPLKDKEVNGKEKLTEEKEYK